MAAKRSDFYLIEETRYEAEKTLLLIGACDDGPVKKVFSIVDIEDAKKVMGDGDLLHAYLSAYESGARDILLYRINGKESSLPIFKDKEEVFRLTSSCGSDEYNKIKVSIFATHLFLDETGIGGKQRIYPFDKFKTVEELCDEINKDSFCGLNHIEAHSWNNSFDTFKLTQGAYLLQDGQSENWYSSRYNTFNIDTHKEKFRKELSLFFIGDEDASWLEEPDGPISVVPASVISIVGIGCDDDKELIDLVGNYCLEKTNMLDVQCVAVIGTSPVKDNQSNVDELHQLAKERGTMESDSYVEVVKGFIRAEKDSPFISLSSNYAGAKVANEYHISMTNKKLHPFFEIDEELLSKDVDSLKSSGYICIVPSIRRGFVPYSSVSFFQGESKVFKKPYAIRTCQKVIKSISIGLEDLIGEQLSATLEKNIRKNIQDVLLECQKNSMLKDSNFDIHFTSVDKTLTISLELLIHGEVEVIQTKTSVRMLGKGS